MASFMPSGSKPLPPVPPDRDSRPGADGPRLGCWAFLAWVALGASFPVLIAIAAIADSPAIAVASSSVAVVWALANTVWVAWRTATRPAVRGIHGILAGVYLLYAFVAGLWLQYPALHGTVISRRRRETHLDFGDERFSPLLDIARDVGALAFGLAVAGPAAAYVVARLVRRVSGAQGVEPVPVRGRGK